MSGNLTAGVAYADPASENSVPFAPLSIEAPERSKARVGFNASSAEQEHDAGFDESAALQSPIDLFVNRFLA